MSESTKGVALITGAAQGIGRGIALRLAQDGFDVAVNDIPSNVENLNKVVEEIKAIGRQSVVLVADVSVDEEVKGMVEGVVEKLGGLDVLVANAGIARFEGLADTTVEAWDRIFAINVRGTFLCYKYAGIQMIAQGRGGRIIGASSVAGKRGYGYLAAYCATKFAVRGLTQSAAQEYGPHGITVNAYAPGGINTQMLADLDIAVGDKSGDKGNSLSNELLNVAIVKHLGQPNDIANVVSFLASKESSFITGQSISCDGGIYFD